LFLGEVLRVPTASEESVNGATTFLLAEAHAGAPVGGAGAFLFVALVTGAVATGAEAIAAAFLLGEVLTGAADAGFCFEVVGKLPRALLLGRRSDGCKGLVLVVATLFL
jgi:hypothetical protein